MIANCMKCGLGSPHINHKSEKQVMTSKTTKKQYTDIIQSLLQRIERTADYSHEQSQAEYKQAEKFDADTLGHLGAIDDAERLHKQWERFSIAGDVLTELTGIHLEQSEKT